METRTQRYVGRGTHTERNVDTVRHRGREQKTLIDKETFSRRN